MNAHKKMKELGFKKTVFYKPGHDPKTYESCMVLDNEETKYEYKDGKHISSKFEKKHPKANSFWFMKYNESCTLWALVENHNVAKIWLENKNGESKKYRFNTYNNKVDKGDARLQVIFDISDRESSKLEGKDQIINLLPKELRRDYLLEQLFGK